MELKPRKKKYSIHLQTSLMKENTNMLKTGRKIASSTTKQIDKLFPTADLASD